MTTNLLTDLDATLVSPALEARLACAHHSTLGQCILHMTFGVGCARPLGETQVPALWRVATVGAGTFGVYTAAAFWWWNYEKEGGKVTMMAVTITTDVSLLTQ